MVRPAEFGHTFDCDEVGTDTADLCAHSVKHKAKLLQVRFTCGVVDGRRPLSQNRCHDDVGRTCNRGLVEQHVTSFQVRTVYCEKVLSRIEVEFRPKLLKSKEVSVKS